MILITLCEICKQSIGNIENISDKENKYIYTYI